jgi:hypothetical protein
MAHASIVHPSGLDDENRRGLLSRRAILEQRLLQQNVSGSAQHLRVRQNEQ